MRVFAHILVFKTVARGELLCYSPLRYVACSIDICAPGETSYRARRVRGGGNKHRKGGRVRTSFDFRKHRGALCARNF